MKRANDEVNSRGSEYDYGYKTTAFLSVYCLLGCQTIEVTNTVAFLKQGLPEIGQRNGLNPGDIQQANSLYNCPKRGVTGVLVVHVRNGQSLRDTDPILNSPDPYVKIVVVDSSGLQYGRATTTIIGETSPNWNEYLTVPEREWQFFRIQILDNDDFFYLRADVNIRDNRDHFRRAQWS